MIRNWPRLIGFILRISLLQVLFWLGEVGGQNPGTLVLWLVKPPEDSHLFDDSIPFSVAILLPSGNQTWLAGKTLI